MSPDFLITAPTGMAWQQALSALVANLPEGFAVTRVSFDVPSQVSVGNISTPQPEVTEVSAVTAEPPAPPAEPAAPAAPPSENVTVEDLRSRFDVILGKQPDQRTTLAAAIRSNGAASLSLLTSTQRAALMAHLDKEYP